jgi:hypothetical protein
MDGVGSPVVVTVNVPIELTLKLVELALVIVGIAGPAPVAETTIKVYEQLASGAIPLDATKVKE